jgi:predicted TIM-barrel fold metal-dependent hydrolase
MRLAVPETSPARWHGVRCGCCRALPGLGAAPALRRSSSKTVTRSASRPAAKKKGRARPAAALGIIDVHHHIAPPAFVQAMARAGVSKRNQWQEEVYEGWSPQHAVDLMDQGGCATAITSISNGAALAAHPDRVRIARECNEYAAQLARDFPGRFGHFATLPMPDIDACLKEMEYALDVLKMDGVDLRTSYGTRYLGDPEFAPIYQELERRKAIIYSHPHEPVFARNILPGVPGSTIEFCADTARAIASVLFSGTAMKYPNVRFIWSHSGGVMPYITERFTRLAARKDHAGKFPKGVLVELRKFYYEVAQAAHPWALSSLTLLSPIGHILFGTDFPYRTSKEIEKQLVQFEFSPKDLKAINRDNALKLFPRYR